MPSKQLRRVYNQHDWNRASRMDKLLIHIVDPEMWPLSNQDAIYLERIRKCFIVVTSTFSDVTMAAILKREFPTLNVTQIAQLRQDCNRFYDTFDIETKKFNWIKQRERMMRHLEIAVGKNDLPSIAKFEKIIQAMRLEMPETVDDNDAFIPDFDFTTDAKYLETEDIDYEEE